MRARALRCIGMAVTAFGGPVRRFRYLLGAEQMHMPALSSAQRMVDILISSGGLRGAALSPPAICWLPARSLVLHMPPHLGSAQHMAGTYLLAQAVTAVSGPVRRIRYLLGAWYCTCSHLVVRGALWTYLLAQTATAFGGHGAFALLAVLGA